jgi:hypothetical protein
MEKFRNEKWEELSIGPASNPLYTFFKRCSNNRLLGENNKYEEFLCMIEDITGDNFINDLNFIHIEPPCSKDKSDWICEDECENCDTTLNCLCTQNIKKKAFIKHKSGRILAVGSCCVLKVAPDDSKIVKSLNKFHCIFCSTELCDRRTDIRKDGFCSKNCKDFFEHVVQPREELLRMKTVPDPVTHPIPCLFTGRCDCGTYLFGPYPRCFDCEKKIEKTPCKRCNKLKNIKWDYCFGCKNFKK